MSGRFVTIRWFAGSHPKSTSWYCDGTCLTACVAITAPNTCIYNWQLLSSPGSPDTGKRRYLFLTILEETRRKYHFVVHGYVIMPEHFHLLLTEPEIGDPSVIMKVIKQRFARRFHRTRARPGGRTDGALGVDHGSSLAKAFLRLQRVERAQTD